MACEEGARFAVRAYDIERHGIEGELYVFGHVDARGESWAAWDWSRYRYPLTSPQAVPPPFPDSILCINGICLEWGGDYYRWSPAAHRLDFRDGSITPALSRGRATRRPMWQRPAEEGDPRVLSRWAEILAGHLATAERAKPPDGWAYKQALVRYFPPKSFWSTLPGMIPLRSHDALQLVSLREATEIPQFATTSTIRRAFSTRRETGRGTAPLPDGAQTIVAKDLARLSAEHAGELFRNRSVQRFRLLSPRDMAIWRTCSRPEVLPFERGSRPAYVVDFGLGRVIGIEIHKTTDSIYPAILFNSANQVISWLLRVRSTCAAGEHGFTREQFDRFYALLDDATRYLRQEELGPLNAYLKAWRSMCRLDCGLPTVK